MSNTTADNENPYAAFRNDSRHPIGLDGTTWQTVEHYLHAQKFEDSKVWYQFLTAKTIEEARAIVHANSRSVRRDWAKIEREILKKAVLAKVLQHYKVRKTLLETDENMILSVSTEDTDGNNLLGSVLLEIKAELTQDGPYDELKNAKLPIWLQCPEIPRYSIGWRMGYGEDVAWEFSLWWRGLSEETKEKYKQMHPEPKGWRGWYKGEITDEE